MLTAQAYLERETIMEGILIVLILTYFIPSLVAVFREKDNTVAIFVLNLVAGWTLVGWVVALVWAVTKDEEEKV